VAGQTVPYAGPVRGKATVIFRATDIQMKDPSAEPGEGMMALAGVLEESLFLGAHYRHYVRLGASLILADSPDPRPSGPVRLVVSSDKVQVYG
jgi:hypothetical protein